MGIGENVGENTGLNTGQEGYRAVGGGNGGNGGNGDPPAGAWIYEADFEGGTLGTRSTGQVDNFVGMATALTLTSYFDNAQTHSGTRSYRCGIKAQSRGDDSISGFGGKTRGFASNVNHGGDYWCKCWYYVPSSFDLRVGGSGLKNQRTFGGDLLTFWREGDSISVGSSVGHSAGPDGKTFSARANDSEWGGKDNLWTFPRNQWWSLETYIAAHRNSGEFRVWGNNTLIFEDPVGQTLGAGEYIYKTGIFQYWNDKGAQTGSPSDSHCWIDDFTYTNSDYYASNTDARGNKFLGSSY